MSVIPCHATWETTDPSSRRGSRLRFVCSRERGHDGEHRMVTRGYSAGVERIGEVTW